MPNKTLLLVCIFFLFIILATAPLMTVKAAPACTVSVVFGNGPTGLSTISMNQSTDFNVSVTITNAPDIDFFSINITWDPAVITLKHNDTTIDVLNGGFMPTFTGPSAALTKLAKGNLGDVCGFNTVGYNSGNGTLFKMVMHSIKPANSSILIIAPNLDSYIMHTDTQETIDAVVNGTILIPEFSVSMLLTVFLVASTLAIAAATVSSRKRRVLPKI